MKTKKERIEQEIKKCLKDYRNVSLVRQVRNTMEIVVGKFQDEFKTVENRNELRTLIKKINRER